MSQNENSNDNAEYDSYIDELVLEKFKEYNDKIKVSEDLIYGVMANRYGFEWQRWRDFTNDAANIVGFLGILLTLWVTLGINEASIVNGTWQIIYFLSGFCFLVSFFFAGCANFCGTQHMQVIPDEDKILNKHDLMVKKYSDANFIKSTLLDEYFDGNNSNNNIDNLKNVLYNDYHAAIKNNHEIVLKKANFVKRSILYLVCGFIGPFVLMMLKYIVPITYSRSLSIISYNSFILLLSYLLLLPLIVQLIIFFLIHYESKYELGYEIVFLPLIIFVLTDIVYLSV